MIVTENESRRDTARGRIHSKISLEPRRRDDIADTYALRVNEGFSRSMKSQAAFSESAFDAAVCRRKIPFSDELGVPENGRTTDHKS